MNSTKKILNLLVKWDFLTTKMLSSLLGNTYGTVYNQMNLLYLKKLVIKKRITRENIWMISLAGWKLMGIKPLFQKSVINFYELEHQTCLSEIAGDKPVENYWTENELRRKNSGWEFSKIPDLYYIDEKNVGICIEYERTQKTIDRFDENLRKYDLIVSANNCVKWIVPSKKMERFVNSRLDKHINFKEKHEVILEERESEIKKKISIKRDSPTREIKFPIIPKKPRSAPAREEIIRLIEKWRYLTTNQVSLLLDKNYKTCQNLLTVAYSKGFVKKDSKMLKAIWISVSPEKYEQKASKKITVRYWNIDKIDRTAMFIAHFKIKKYSLAHELKREWNFKHCPSLIYTNEGGFKIAVLFFDAKTVDKTFFDKMYEITKWTDKCDFIEWVVPNVNIKEYVQKRLDQRPKWRRESHIVEVFKNMID